MLELMGKTWFGLACCLIILSLFSCSNQSDSKEKSEIKQDIVKIKKEPVVEKKQTPKEEKKSEFEIVVGETAFFETQKGAYRYELSLTKTAKYSYTSDFDIYLQDSLIYTVSDDFSIVDSTRQISYKGRFQYQCRGYRYRSKEHLQNLDLVVPKGEVKTVGYNYGMKNNGEKFLVPEELILYRVGVGEPYSNYIDNVLSSYHSAKIRLKKNPKERWVINNNKKQLFELETLFFYLENNLKDTYLKDPEVLDKFLYYDLDSIAGVLKDKGISYWKTNPKYDVPQKIHFNETEGFSAIVTIDYKSNVTQNIFKEIFIDTTFTGRPVFPLGQHLFHSYSRPLTKFGKRYLWVLMDDGFENISHILTLWRKEGNYYYLDQILDKVLHVGIGGVDVEQTIKINKQQHLFLGTKSGGDAGDTWGSIWLALLTEPNHLEIILEEDWFSYYEGGERLTYKLNQEDSTIIFKREWYSNIDSVKIDKEAKIDTINYFDLIEKKTRKKMSKALESDL